jgi:hypothetical protein
MHIFNGANYLPALCSSGLIMTYPDDKSMTEMGRNVHVPVMLVGYTFVPDDQMNNPPLA